VIAPELDALLERRSRLANAASVALVEAECLRAKGSADAAESFDADVRTARGELARLDAAIAGLRQTTT
jgi:hypothetical protein